MNKLAVVIPSRNIDNLRPCIAAVRKHEPEARIIVVDDGLDWSSYWGKDLLQPAVDIVPGVKPFIFARNVNLGIHAAGDSDVILLNDDALLESPGGFRTMQRAAADNLAVGIVGAVTDLTGQPEQRRPRNQWLEATAAHVAAFGLRALEHIAFVCVLIPRATIQVLAAMTPSYPTLLTGGLLDERYTAYGSDDLDYCMQVRKASLCVCVHDACFVNHGSLHSSFRGDPRAAGDIWTNHRLLRAKWGMGPNSADPLYRLGTNLQKESV